jgi:hypothetical protein
MCFDFFCVWGLSVEMVELSRLKVRVCVLSFFLSLRFRSSILVFVVWWWISVGNWTFAFCSGFWFLPGLDLC